MILLAAVLLAGPLVPPAPPAALSRRVRLEVVATGLDEPIGMAVAPGDPQRRLFVVEKGGKVRIIKGGRVLGAPFLDLSGQVSGDYEQGLLGLAFHPRFASNGRFYVNYTDRAGDTRIVAYRASADRADPASRSEFFFIDQPYRNHNGGHLLFGPDGRLYVGTGDGGSANDPHGHGQNPRSVLGKMLRFDVDAGGAPETLMIGLRNPWRYSFDRKTGDLYIADVGQNRWEEVNVVPAGRLGGQNLGWAILEGTHCLHGPDCDDSGLLMPAIEYAHGGGSCSITGGHIYRGKALPELAGHYFYADYCSGLLRSFRWAQGAVREQYDWGPVLAPGGSLRQIASFGEDHDGELYVVSQTGRIWRFSAK